MSEETIEKVYAMPRIGDQAPDFEAVTTKGKIKFSDLMNHSSLEDIARG